MDVVEKLLHENNRPAIVFLSMSFTQSRRSDNKIVTPTQKTYTRQTGGKFAASCDNYRLEDNAITEDSIRAVKTSQAFPT